MIRPGLERRLARLEAAAIAERRPQGPPHGLVTRGDVALLERPDLADKAYDLMAHGGEPSAELLEALTDFRPAIVAAGDAR